MNLNYKFSVLLGLVYFFGALAVAQQHPVANDLIAKHAVQALQYRSVGPSRGGRVTAVTGIPGQPFTFLFGSTGGGVWKTSDAGLNWTNISDGQISVGSVGAIEVAPSDPNVIYVGTGSACPRGNVSLGNGMYRSTNSGKSWKHIGLPKAGLIGDIAIHPRNEDHVFVAALGNIFSSNPERGIYRSKDGGLSWEKVLYLSDSTGAIAIEMDPSNPRILYAGMWTARRKPWTLIDGSNESGVYKSEDGGDTWVRVKNGLPDSILGRMGIAISPANPERIWVMQQALNEEDGGLYRSDDGGKSWERIYRDHRLRQRGWYYSHIIADPANEHVIYGLNVNFYRSIDGGNSFDEEINVPHGDNHALWINPNNPDIMIAGNDGGACVSLNRGKTWSSQNNQPTAEFYRVTVDNRFPYRLYAGQQDNSTISVPSHTLGDLTPFQEWLSIGGSECADVAVDPRNPDIVYAGAYSGEITRFDLSKNHLRQVTSWPHYTEGWEQRNLKYRFQWNFPIRINPHNPDEVYHTSNYVMRSVDQGQSWEVISPDLTRNIDAYLGIPGGPVQHDGTGVEIYCTLFAFEISPHQNGVFWVGSDDGLVHISRDAGKNWKDITPKGMLREATVNMIDLSAHGEGRAFIAVQDYRNGDPTPYIYKTDNFGASWTLLTTGANGIPSDHFVRVVREDPKRKGLLYAGTEYGMYLSLDEGRHWQSLQLNLPYTPITDLEIHQDDLVLSTQGRSFWILDDLTPLRQLRVGSDVDLALYKPKPAYRTQLDGNTLLNEARIFYSVPDTTTEVRLEIYDAANVAVQVYSTKADSSKGEIELQTKLGQNLLEWDLTYPAPKLLEGFSLMDISYPGYGPLAPTGTYTIRLSQGTKVINEELIVLKDPRWTHVSDADLMEQFQMAQTIGRMFTKAHNLIRNLRSVRTQTDRIPALSNAAGMKQDWKLEIAEINKELLALEEEYIQNKIEVSQDEINYPSKFSNYIGRLYSVACDLDSKPTEGVRIRYKELQVSFDTFEKEYEALLQKVNAFNNKLLQENVKPIFIPLRD